MALQARTTRSQTRSMPRSEKSNDIDEVIENKKNLTTKYLQMKVPFALNKEKAMDKKIEAANRP
jgi:hypothetical protein